MHYEHLIWDWNGTLMDDAWLCVEVINAIRADRHMPPITIPEYRQQFDFPVIAYYRRIGFDLDKESFHDLSLEYITEYDRRRTECALQAHCRATLSQLKAAGVTQSILSAYRQQTLEEIILHYELSPYFARLVGQANIYGESKVEMGKQWVARLPDSPEQILLVGDTVHDFEVAQATGIDSILVSHGHHERDRLEACGVPVLDSLRDVPGFLASVPTV